MAKIIFTSEQWAEIQVKYESVVPVVVIAEEFGIRPYNVSRWAKRKGWNRHGELAEKVIETARAAATEKMKFKYLAEAEEANEIHKKVFRLGQKSGVDVALEALQRVCSNDELCRFAKVCRVWNIMRPYMEALS
jgi:uncharacterized protein YjcR